MNKKLLLASLCLVLMLSACGIIQAIQQPSKPPVTGYVYWPNLSQAIELTDKACPEQPPNGIFFKIFWIGKTEYGCYASDNQKQVMYFVMPDNRTNTGKAEFETFTYKQLEQARINAESANAAGLNAMREWQRSQPQPVQIAPFSCIRSGPYTSCQ